MIWLTGSRGMLGTEVEALLQRGNLPFVATDIEIDISLSEAVNTFMAVHPDIAAIINCAAYTDVEEAEEDKDAAFRINAGGPRALAAAAAEQDVLLYHISTDYIFPGNGDAPWAIDDAPAPINVYGASKLDGEAAIRASGCRHGIFRTQWLYGAHGRNFINTILEKLKQGGPLKVIHDQFGAPTWARVLAGALLAALQQGLAGIFHMACEGRASWYDVACAIRDLSGQTGEITGCATEEYPTKAARPRNSVMDLSALHRAGIQLGPWRDVLRDYLDTELMK